jgi:hypothetical protein
LHNSQNIPETRKKKFVENFPEIVWQWAKSGFRRK